MKKYSINADIIRILAGLAVVFIHITDAFLLYPPYYGVRDASWMLLSIINVASRISVPLFIMLSGYLLLDTDKGLNIQSFYRRRLVRVFIPLIFWVTVFFIWESMTGVQLSVFKIFTEIIALRIDHLYFLVIILELYFLTPMFLIFFKSTRRLVHTIFFVSTLIFTISLHLINLFVLKAKVDTTINILVVFMPYVAYYIGGYYLRNIKLSSPFALILKIIFIATVFITVFSSNEVLINTHLLFFDSPNIILMSFIIFMLLINNERSKKISIQGIVGKSIKNVAGTIFGIYLVHIFIIHILDNYFSLKPGLVGSPMWLYVGYKYIIVFGISYLIVRIGKKIPYVRMIFG